MNKKRIPEKINVVKMGMNDELLGVDAEGEWGGANNIAVGSWFGGVLKYPTASSHHRG